MSVITERLVAQAVKMRPDSAKWQWSVQVIDDPKTVNAWCMAGGRMALYTGLIMKVDPTDDELAQVMGHEIAHALANHTAERMSTAIAANAGILAAGRYVGQAGQAMAMTAAAATVAIEAAEQPHGGKTKPTRSASNSLPERLRPACRRHVVAEDGEGRWRRAADPQHAPERYHATGAPRCVSAKMLPYYEAVRVRRIPCASDRLRLTRVHGQGRSCSGCGGPTPRCASPHGPDRRLLLAA